MQGFPSPKCYKLLLRGTSVHLSLDWPREETMNWWSSTDHGLLNWALDGKELQIKCLPLIWIFVWAAWTEVAFAAVKTCKNLWKGKSKNVHWWAGSRVKMFISNAQPFEDLDLSFSCEIPNFFCLQLNWKCSKGRFSCGVEERWKNGAIISFCIYIKFHLQMLLLLK